MAGACALCVCPCVCGSARVACVCAPCTCVLTCVLLRVWPVHVALHVCPCMCGPAHVPCTCGPACGPACALCVPCACALACVLLRVPCTCGRACVPCAWALCVCSARVAHACATGQEAGRSVCSMHSRWRRRTDQVRKLRTRKRTVYSVKSTLGPPGAWRGAPASGPGRDPGSRVESRLGPLQGACLSLAWVSASFSLE